jgi:hypothetical protein
MSNVRFTGLDGHAETIAMNCDRLRMLQYRCTAVWGGDIRRNPASSLYALA